MITSGSSLPLERVPLLLIVGVLSLMFQNNPRKNIMSSTKHFFVLIQIYCIIRRLFTSRSRYVEGPCSRLPSTTSLVCIAISFVSSKALVCVGEFVSRVLN